MLKLHLIDSLPDSLPVYNQVCNKYSDKSNLWSLGLSVASSAI